MNVADKIKQFGLKQVYGYLDKDPEKNIPKVLDWLEKYDVNNEMKNQIETVRKAISDKDNNWYRLVNSLYTDVDSGVRKALFEGALINGSIIGSTIEKKNQKKYGCNVPWAILMDPTSACNLHCTGCWAAEYGHSMNLTLQQLNSIIEQGKKLGIYIYIYSGGEPLVRKADIIKLCEMHPECAFLAFTNATLLDDEFADEMLRVKNFVPAISVEGFEEDTDFRRGKGTFNKVMEAMERLRARKLLFGISCCYTSKNTDTIGSEEYFDKMVEWGAKFAWFFTYMPVGKDAVPELMATAGQRRFMYDRIRQFRNTKPLFTMDFWNDGEYVGGCIAGGRSYLHINANGDVEPCAFIHYSDTSIKDHTLLEALRAPLFMGYHDAQPFNCNHLRPCPLLDNPGALSKIVDDSEAKSTDMVSPEDVHELSGKCKEAAENWAPVADDLWAKGHHVYGGAKQNKGE